MFARFNIGSNAASTVNSAKHLFRKFKAGLSKIKDLPWRTHGDKIFHLATLILGKIFSWLKSAWAKSAASMQKLWDRISAARKRSSSDPEETPQDNADPPKEQVQASLEPVLSDRIEKILADRLPNAMRTFNQVCQEVGKDFFALGEELQGLYSETNLLARMASEAVVDDSELSAAAKLTEIVNGAQTLLTQLGQDHVTIESNLECIASVVLRLKHLLDQCITIKKLGKALRMIGLNISIESTRNMESHDIFNDLAQQIRELSDTVTIAASKIKEDTEAAKENLSNLHSDMDQSLTQLKEVSSSAENSMGQAIPEVENIVALSMEILNQTHDQSEQISQQVGQIVMDIQLHDSVSQRIEHVGISLLEAHEALIEVCRKKDDQQTEVELGDTLTILELQFAQVERVIHEIREILKTTYKAFEQIEVVVANLLVSLKNLHSGDESRGTILSAENNHIQVLKTIFFRLNDLIKQGDQEMERANRATNNSRKTAERLSRHAKNIRDLNFEIHLKALNAIASSLRLGSKGRTIEVLVQDMKALAIQSNEDVVQIESVIKEIITESGSMQTKNNSHSDDPSSEKSNMGGLLSDFSDVCTRFESAIGEVLRHGGGLEQQIETIKSKLPFLTQFSDQLDLPCQRLHALITELKPHVNNRSDLNEQLHLSLSQRYTTQQERDVHDELFPGSRPVSQQISDETSFQSEDIDLFTEDCDSGSGQDGSQEDSSLDDNIELF